MRFPAMKLKLKLKLRDVLADEHHDGVARDAALLADAVDLFVRLGLGFVFVFWVLVCCVVACEFAGASARAL